MKLIKAESVADIMAKTFKEFIALPEIYLKVSKLNIIEASNSVECKIN